jgi:hypothetical protein
MKCPNCGTQNDDTFNFCLRCGSSLVAAPPAAVSQPAAVPPPMTTEPVYNPPPSYGTPPPVSPPLTNYQTPQPPRQYTTPSFQGYPQQQQQQPQAWQNNPYLPPAFSPSALNIWGPFAGFGTRRKHLGWLLDNQGDCAGTLVKQVKTLFQERQITGAAITEETLTAKGLIVENRPYFILRRKLASVGLYIAQYGKDLYVSLVSYLKPPISNFRVLVLIFCALFWLYTAFIYPKVLENAANGLIGNFNPLSGYPSGSSDSGLGFLLCVIGPLGLVNTIALIIFVIYSLYKWFTEKDILAGLRTTPNEFNEDDLMGMEKAAEQTVRIAIDQIGLDSNELKPIHTGSGGRLI